jgi:outer membrane murein-binding lipoprotein Lpp
VLLVSTDLSTATASAEIFDWRSDTWSPVAPPPVARVHAQGILLPNGRVMIAGGADSTQTTVLNSVDIFDPETGWAAAAPMSVGRVFGAIGVLPSGRAIVAGGVDISHGGIVFNTSVETYDADAGAWRAEGPLPTGRAAMGFAVAGGQLVLAGGIDAQTQYSDTAMTFTSNRPPVAVASANPPIALTVPGSRAAVTLSPAGSSDEDDANPTFRWMEGNTVLATTVGATPATIGLDIGVHQITLTVDDGFGGVSTASVNVTVLDGLGTCTAHVSDLQGQVTALQAQVAALQGQVAAANAAIQAAGNGVQNNFRATFGDPAFVINGATPADKLGVLIAAILDLKKADKQGLYRALLPPKK